MAMIDHAIGGNDTLVGGARGGDGQVTGGNDSFDLLVGKASEMHDGFHGLGEMSITGTGTDTVIAFDPTDSVALGISDPSVLHASDFILA